MRGRPGVPGSGFDAGSFGEDVISAACDLAQLLDGFVQVAAFGGIPHRGAVEGAVEQLILSAQSSAYRMVRF
jgi:hypothetical protein